jgi:hypothetical protein
MLNVKKDYFSKAVVSAKKLKNKPRDNSEIEQRVNEEINAIKTAKIQLPKIKAKEKHELSQIVERPEIKEIKEQLENAEILIYQMSRNKKYDKKVIDKLKKKIELLKKALESK